MKAYYLPLSLALLLFGCNQGSSTFSAAEVEEEAKVFMAGYAEDMINNDRPAVGARFHSEGGRFQGNGNIFSYTKEEITSMFVDSTWVAPDNFTWEDMSYDVLTGDMVVVTGKYVWEFQDGSERNNVWSYGAVLVRDGDELKIKHESYSRNYGKTLCNALGRPDGRTGSAIVASGGDLDAIRAELCPDDE